MKTFYSTLAVAIMIGFSGCDTASTENPTISLQGETNIQVQLGNYSIPEGGATANDAKDGDLSNSIVRDHNIDFTRAGQYQITYDVKDSDGNTAHAVRNVTIVDANNGSGGYYDGGQTYTGAIPVITFPDGDPVYLSLGESFEKTYTAYDFEDGDLGAQVEILNAGFDANTPAGTYVVTYKVTDSSGNTVEKRRTVIVGYNNSNTDQTLNNFASWYSQKCGKTFNSSLYDVQTGAYDGAISCRDRNLYDVDLTELGIFSSIRSIDFSDNHLTSIDFSPLANTRVIEKVILSRNDFEYIDFTPLYNLKNINELWVDGNNLNYTQAQREEIYQGFNNRSFRVYF